MCYIAIHSNKDRNVDLSEIAEVKQIPKHFLSKILQLLVKHKLLISMRGPSGGFKLGKPAREISLIEVVEVIDGLEIFDQCGIEYKPCNPDNPCPIHNEYSEHRNRVYHLFQTKTLDCITEDIVNGDPIIDLEKLPKKNNKLSDS